MSLRGSLRRAAVWGALIWQVIPLLAIATAEEGRRTLWLLLSLQAVVTIVTALVCAERLHPKYLFVSATPALIAFWAVADTVNSPLPFAAIWTRNILQILPPLVLDRRGSRRFAALIGLGVPAAVGILRPEWRFDPMVTLMIAALGIHWAATRGVAQIERFARGIDAGAAAASREREVAAAERAAIAEAAEQARTVHDTIVNTLGAVAGGGAAIADAAVVRLRCETDLLVLNHLLTDGAEAHGPGIDEQAAALGIELRWDGLGPDELASLLADLPAPAARAIDGAVREVLVNAAKHAPDAAVTLRAAESDGLLLIEVADDGPGFDPQGGLGSGLTESVLARAREAGVTADLSSVPGTGTRVRFHVPRSTGSVRPDPAEGARIEDVRESIEDVRRRAGLVWCSALVLLGVVLETANRPGDLTWTYLMLAVVAATAAVVAVAPRRGVGTAVALALAAAVPVAYVLGAASTGFATGDVLSWQCLGATGPFVALLVLTRRRRLLAVAAAATLAVAAVLSVRGFEDSTEIGALLVIGTAPLLWGGAAWWIFSQALDAIGRRAAADQDLAAAARVEAAERGAGSTATRRWRQAGLERSARILSGLASGSLDPADASVRRSCGDEERYLRQIMLLEPELFRMGHWFAEALAEARRRDVHLTVRTGGNEVEDDLAAAALGRMLVRAVEHAPEGSDLTASLFTTGRRLRYAIVALAPVAAGTLSTEGAPAGWDAQVDDVGGAQILEVVRGETVRVPAGGADLALAWGESGL